MVTDPDIPALNCTLTNIAPNASKTCTGDYIVTQDDMDAGTYTNTASASGTSPTGAAIAGNSDSATVTLQTRIESAVFDKIPSTTTYTAVGDSIDYVFSVRNTGNVTLTNVVVVDSPLGFTCLIARVDVGATDNTTCKVTKTITQEDIDEGQFVNTATAESPTGLNEADTETATGPTRSPSFEFEKSSTDSFAAVGDQVEFDFLVRNTGNVTLTNTVITDSFFNPNLSCTIPTLAPTATDNTTCSGTYTITQADDSKQAAWRTDPAKSGAGGATGDIGTHAFHLAGFVTGLTLDSLAADLQSFVAGRTLDDNAHVMLRYQGGARGMLWCSQVAPGNENALRLRIYGAAGGLEWAQENPNQLWFTPFGAPKRLITRGGAGAGHAAARMTRIPAGHPEGYLEGFANIYAEAAIAIEAHRTGAQVPPDVHFPTVQDGLAGVQFVDACVRSSKRDGAWMSLS